MLKIARAPWGLKFNCPLRWVPKELIQHNHFKESFVEKFLLYLILFYKNLVQTTQNYLSVTIDSTNKVDDYFK